ncbi:hypothetical protein QC762_203405 [Podospora pseudocomata]|uniref:Uncharacterized protein n=4 Tax=Sordariales TaxID=5139 RepID=A0ABR0GR53_9PEZI|nr:hypothetical protein QC761_203405 [Podospora bellae-mahoneyi]KAK4658059.1 hypothetical protein QC762_203405 [Podospora pseudocomata]
MCKYYAHAFLCKHITFSFATFCDPASMIQTRCGERSIWQTIRMEEYCDDCKAYYPAPSSSAHSSRRR